MRKKLKLMGLWLLVGSAGVVGRAASPTGWVEARSAHFAVVTDGSAKEAARVAGQFERMRTVFRELLPTAEADSAVPVTVLAVKDRQGMRAMVPTAYLASRQMDVAGLFLPAPDRNYILMRLDARQEHAYATVYHEYTHFMLRKADTWLPLWMNEGLAQFYENTDIDEKTAWLGQTKVQALNLLKRSEMLPLETLLRVDARSPYYHDEEKGSIFYAESWALTHYLMVSDRMQGTHRIRDYARRMEEGEDAVAAAGHAFGDLKKLEAGLEEYIMQGRKMYFMMPVQEGTGDGEVTVRGVESADADALRADVMMHTGRSAEAKALDDEVLKAEPRNALAHETMGALRHRDGDMASAQKWYGDAVALDPGSYVAQFYYSVATLRMGGRDDAAVETGLRTAMRLNPEFAAAYDALAMVYAMRHQRLDEAHALDVRAIELEPGKLSFRLDCADVLAEQRQYTDAMAVLEAAARLARTPEEKEATRSRMAWVEQTQTMAGLAVEKRQQFGQ